MGDFAKKGNKLKGEMSSMWYRVKVDEDRFFVDEATLAYMKADGEKFEIETTNKWLEGVVRQFDENYSDGEVLDEVIKLIDEGKCNA